MPVYCDSADFSLIFLAVDLQLTSLFFSGRHKQEESLFEEMLQVSNAVVCTFLSFLTAVK